MRRKSLVLPLLLAASIPLAGCRIIGVCVYTVAATVGLAGYAVYKTGDAAVTGVGKAGKAVAAGSKSVATVMYVNGDLKVEHPFDVRTVYAAADRALRKAGFVQVKGSADAISGELSAVTRENANIKITLQGKGEAATEVRIRVGTKGDLKTAEMINGLILKELPEPATTAAVSRPIDAAREDML